MKKSLRMLFVLLLAFSPLFVSADTTTDTSGATPTDTSAAATPTATDAAYQYQRDGIFGCNQNGSYAMSVGALSAIGGAYVPVADAAVELNTGTLVYQQCVLREVIDNERQAALAAFTKKATQAIQTGRNGNPLYPVNISQDQLGVSDQAVASGVLQSGVLSSLNPTLQAPVTRAFAQSYYTNTRTPQNVLVCPYQGDLAAAQGGNPSGSIWDALGAFENPACNSAGATVLVNDLSQNAINQALQNWQDELNWGQGFYPVVDANGNVVTPSSVVNQSYEGLLQSPVRQLESANDIGQMISALYAGLTTQVISDSGGLAGISQSVGGQPSYLDQVVSETSAGVRNAADNVALNILGAAQQTEQQYFQAVSSIASALTQSIGQLRSAELQCWNLVIPKVCTSSLSSTNTCTGANGTTLKVATSTVFSQAVISAQITPVATTTINNVNASQQALSLIANLIAGVTNTASLDAQRLALQQLDSLVAQHQLHTQPDLQNVTQQLSSVQSAMTTLVQNTVQDWSDSTPNGSAFNASNSSGWCNVNSQTTVDTWTSAWKQ